MSESPPPSDFLLFHAKTVHSADACGELAISQSFGILISDPVGGFQQIPRGYNTVNTAPSVFQG